MPSNGPDPGRPDLSSRAQHAPDLPDTRLPARMQLREQIRDPKLAARLWERLFAQATKDIVATREFVAPATLLPGNPDANTLADPDVEQFCGDAARLLAEWCHQPRYPELSQQYLRRAGEHFAYAREERLRSNPNDITLASECATAESGVLCRLRQARLAERLLIAEDKRLNALMRAARPTSERVAEFNAACIEILYAFRTVYQLDSDMSLAAQVETRLRDLVARLHGTAGPPWSRLLRTFGRDALHIGAVLADTGRDAEAIPWFRNAREQFSERLSLVGRLTGTDSHAYAEAAADLGIVLLQLNELDEAARLTKLAYDLVHPQLASSPTLLLPYAYNMMMVLEAQGRPHEAQTYRRIVEQLEGTELG